MEKVVSIVVRILILIGSFVVLATLYGSGYVMEQGFASLVFSHSPAVNGTISVRL